jgi:hypothetical protein
MTKTQETQTEAAAAIQRMTERTIELPYEAPEVRGITKDVLLRLNRLAGCGSGKSAAAQVEALIEMLGDVLGGADLYRDYLCAMMADLNDYARVGGIWTGAPSHGPTTAQRAAASARRRTDFEPRYEVRRRYGKEYLVEIRAGSGKDFQVSHADYEAAVAAMTEAGTAGLKFDDLFRRFRALGGGQEQYRLRVVLRFWRLGKPPLITCDRARYRSLLPTEGFMQAASVRYVSLNVKRS